MKSLFNPNWHQINKSIAAGEIKELRRQENELKKKIQDKINAYLKTKREIEIAAKIKALKDLPAGSQIYYTGNSSSIPFGSICNKAKDGRSRMEVIVNEKHWSIYYTNLKIDQPTPEELSSHKIATRLTSFYNSL